MFAVSSRHTPKPGESDPILTTQRQLEQIRGRHDVVRVAFQIRERDTLHQDR